MDSTIAHRSIFTDGFPTHRLSPSRREPWDFFFNQFDDSDAAVRLGEASKAVPDGTNPPPSAVRENPPQAS